MFCFQFQLAPLHSGAPSVVAPDQPVGRHGRGFIENKHSTDIDFPPPPPRVCMSIHP